MTNPGPTLDEYLHERNAALRGLNIAWARRQIDRPVSDAVLLLSLHKARLECTAIERDLRVASARWLMERGYKSLTGQTITNPEELPE
jgi:hypothetical protein